MIGVDSGSLIEMTSVFMLLFAVFVFLGFYGSRFRKGNLNDLGDWALAGRKLGSLLTFFLQGADWYTAYSILAIPSSVYLLGAFGFFGVAYQAMVFAFAMIFVPVLWSRAHQKGYITSSDFVKDRFRSTTLSIFLALVGIVALLPYIALQIAGLQAVLASMLLGTLGGAQVEEVALVIAFIVLAAFTFTSGLRGATLGAVMKDILVWIALLSIVAVVVPSVGGMGQAFQSLPSKYSTMNPSLAIAFSTSMLGVVVSAYLWPHNVTASLGASSASKLKRGFALAPLYAVPLALADMMGALVNKVPAAVSFLNNFPPASRGIYVIPSLLITQFPPWFAGLALLGVFIGGLVPAAVMAIAQGNLIARNVVKEFKPSLTAKGEADVAKWASAFFKFAALAFVFAVPAGYALQFYLIGAILVIQLLPAVFLGLYTDWLKAEALIVGAAVSIVTGVYMVLVANHFGVITTTLYPTPLGPMYIGVIVLILNLVLTTLLSAVIPRKSDIKVRQST
ncbi:MAG: sodium:solute symporter [Nitrososphaerota archaeon]|nr:sodium:solute symporter [Nitrososphaerota archaeon]